MNKPAGFILRYGIAILAVVATYGVRIALEELVPALHDSSPFVMLFPAIILSAWFGGLGPGILATLLCAAVADYFFLEPVRTVFYRNTLDKNIRLYIFAGEGLFVSLLAGRLQHAVQRTRRSEEQLRVLNDQLEARVAERTRLAEERTDQARRLSFQLTQAERRERRALAELLHDHLQQMLVAAKMRLDKVQRRNEVEGEAAEALDAVGELLDESIAASRSLAVELSPPVLYQAGLAAALEWLGRHQYEKHGLPVAVHAEKDAEPVNEDLRELLFQAARELLFNAVKHARAAQARVSLSPHAGEDGEAIELTIEDNGQGFHAVATDVPRSAGFGLASIRERLSTFNGRLEITSSPGNGTQARIRVPRSVDQDIVRLEPPASPPVPEAKLLPCESCSSSAIRVVVADDHEIVRKGLLELLRQEIDMEVVGEAADGWAALQLARCLQPDVIVMDVSLPGLSGIEATQAIVSELASARVIGFSMHGEREVALAMRKAGAAAFLPKDSKSEELLTAIRTEAGTAPAAGPAANEERVER